MSPRAACRLEAFGFTEVYDYTAGIADWKAAGLPVEGSPSDEPAVADATRPDPPTCHVRVTIGEARDGVRQDWDECIVLDCDGIVVGRLRGKAWDNPGDTPVESVMETGPTTVRPDEPLQPLIDRMTTRGTRLVIVTTPQGKLLGALFREDGERFLAGDPA